MRYLKQGFCCSFLIHIVFIGLVLLVSRGFTGSARTPTIDLSILESVNHGAGTGTDSFPPNIFPGMPSNEPLSDKILPAEDYPEDSNTSPEPEKKIAEKDQIPEPVESEPEIVPEEIPADTPPVPVQAYEDPVPDDVRPEDNKFTVQAENTAAAITSRDNVYQSFAGSDRLFQEVTSDLNNSGFSGGSPETQLSPGNGEPGDGLDSGGYYLKLNYGQIRNLLGNNLVYPKIARRMGWSGEVHVSFLLKMDGTVDEVLIEKSCGFPVLDKSAVKTIEKASPFPNPERDVRLIIPIAYNLD